ncbi:transmembrane protein 181 [Contarinia nasturtii]|uniref:transmembrane protein 181 n=1 Tax=Contarinia nasturtii TaxID=265458 RepID=UPI0012D42CD8|nr:transmembrane protein 181 [Contarinia nasturtii]
MAKLPQDLGYTYHLPSGGILLRIRNTLSQFSDIFSEFNRFITPAPYHDRCERSVHMRLYSLSKREFVMAILAFFVCEFLSIFIGLAGPPITTTTMLSARTLIANTSTSSDKNIMATGPLVMRTPLLNTYAQQLWLIGRMETDNRDNEKFDKTFQINVMIEGMTKDHTPVQLSSVVRNRTRHLVCECNFCDEFTIVHLGFLEYAHYIITVRFYDLEHFHQRYNIKDLILFFKTYNPDFTQIEIWFRFIFLFFSFVVTCWFQHTMRRYPHFDWSIEQKWMSLLLPLLALYNNPFFTLSLLFNSWMPGMLDAVFQSTFLCSLLMFWLCIYHGLRQNERKFITFYLPKLIVITPMWLCAIVLATWEKYNELRDPTYSHFVDTGNFQGFQTFFYISCTMYLLYLALLILKAYSELRSMPFFDMRLKFLTLLMIFVMSVTISLAMNRFGFGVLEDNFVASLSTTYKSSAQFMCFYGLLNFYLYTMAYVYSPSGRPVHETTITKDNPAFSMVNDSDEDVIYGSDDDSRRPLNSSTVKGNDYDDSD